MADLESGVWAGSNPAVTNTNTPFNSSKFVTAMLKGKSGGMALKGGDAQFGTLKTLYEGPRPPHYNPMAKQGAIVLGIGGELACIMWHRTFLQPSLCYDHEIMRYL